MGIRRADVVALMESGRLTVDTLFDLREWMRLYPNEVDELLAPRLVAKPEGVDPGVYSGLVEIYADGACLGNPGPGGIGVYIRRGDGVEIELGVGFRKTTNNRMELYAAIRGIEAVDVSCEVKVFTDSKYVVDAVNKGWAFRWRANGWRKRGGYALNPDLWTRLLALIDARRVSFYWVKGHSGVAGNVRADRLAVGAARGGDLLIDAPYEAQNG